VALLILIAALLYFVPTLIVVYRDHPQKGAIIVLNIFGGWTVLGWVGALVWACTAYAQPADSSPKP
jgi:hypothetical protein